MQIRIAYIIKVFSDHLPSVRIDLFSVTESDSHLIEILPRYEAVTIEVVLVEIRSHLPHPKFRHLQTITSLEAQDLSTENR